jgi:fatty-acyl-CoA synthase
MTEARAPIHLATIWERIAERIPQETALIHGAVERSWAEFDARASRLAAAFKAAGLGPGDKIAIDLYNCPEWLETFYAAIKIRAVPANVNYRYLDAELRHLLGDSHAEALVFHASLGERILRLRRELPRLRFYVQVEEHGHATLPVEAGVARYEELIAAHPPAAPIERSPDDQYLSYTGGTTGVPKGVMFQLGRTMTTMAFLGPMLGLDAASTFDSVGTAARLAEHGQQLVALPASPLMHSTGFSMAALPALAYGGAVVTLTGRSFDPNELLAASERHGVTLIAIVGDAIARPVLRALEETAAAGRNYDLGRLKTICSAGVAWSGDTKEGLFRFLPGVTMMDACGATEGLTYGFRLYRKGDPTSGTNFMPAPGLMVLDEDGTPRPAAPGLTGLLANVTAVAGYYNDPAKTARTYRDINGEWYAVPGDYGRIEADGSLTLLGRGSNTINTGGEKVHPEEIEDLFKGYPGVDDCLVFGMPDERWGQRVTALVQPAAAATLDPAAMIAHARARLAPYKAPKELFVIERVPRAPNGKADYPKAKAMAAELAAR